MTTLHTGADSADDGPGGNGNRPNPKDPPISQEILNARIDARQREMHEFSMNFATSRSQFLQRFMNPEKKDIDEECGYPRTVNIPVELYREMYDREPVATRVVQLMPKECWSVSPMVYEDEGSDEVTDFEKAWDDLARSMRGQSWFQDEEGSPIWECLRRADELSGIGHFGIVLIGFDDGKGLHEPVEGVVSLKPTGNSTFPVTNADGQTFREQVDVSVPRITPEETARLNGGQFVGDDGVQVVIEPVKGYAVNASKGATYGMGIASSPAMGDSSLIGTDAQYVGVQFGPSEYPAAADAASPKRRRLTFMRAFDESLVQIVQYEANILNPRFGMPVMYRVTLNDPREQHSGIGLPLATVQVHWSRIIHLADNRGSSEVFGVPRMRPVLNPLLDVRKVRGGSAEMYWQGALPGWSLETHPQLGGDVEVDDEKNRQMMEDYRKGLQRWLSLMGMSAKSLAPQVVDPKGQIEVQTEAICVQLGCPVRVFKGSERGELASAQDDESWNDRVMGRQAGYVTPHVIVPFVDRMIAAGVLPIPKKGKTLSHAEPKIVPPAPAAGKGGAPGAPKPPGAAGGTPSPKPPGGPNAGGLGISKPGGQVTPTANDMRPDPGFQDDIEEDDLDDDRPNKAGQASFKTITKGGYSVEWPDLDSLGKKDKAAIFAQVMTGMSAYVAGGVQQILPPMEMYTEYLGLTEEKADAILESAEDLERHLQDQHQQAADELNDEGGDDDDPEQDPDDPNAPPKPKGDELRKLPPPGFERKPPPPPPMIGGPPKLGPDGKPLPPEPPKGIADRSSPAFGTNNTFVVNGWVTLTSGQHVFIGDDGKMNFGKSAVKAAQTKTKGKSKDDGVPVATLVDEVKGKGKGPDMRAPDARPGAAKAAAAGAERVGPANAKEVVESLRDAAIGHLPKQMQAAVNAALIASGTKSPEANARWGLAQRLAERVSKGRGATPEAAKHLKATLSAVDTLASGAAGKVAGKAFGSQIGKSIKSMPVATAAYLAWSTVRNPIAVFKAAAGLMASVAKEGVAGKVKSVTEKVKRTTKYLMNESSELSKKDAKVVAKAIERHGGSDWYFALLTAALNHTNDVRQAIAHAEEAFSKNAEGPTANEFVEEDHPRAADGKFGSGDGHNEHAHLSTRGWAGHLKGYEKDHPEGAPEWKPTSQVGQQAKAASEAIGRLAKATGEAIEKTATSIVQSKPGQLATAVGSAVKAAVGRVGKSAFDALPERGQQITQASATWVVHAGHALEKFLEGFHQAGQEAAAKIAKGWGMNDHQVASLGRVLGTADGIARWGPTGYALHTAEIASGWLGFAIVKAGFYTPVASLAFVAAAGPPLAAMKLMRGAHSAIRSIADKVHGAIRQPQMALANAAAPPFDYSKMADLVAAAMTKNGWSQWYEALLHAALDQTHGDVKASIELAQHAYDRKKGPAHYDDPTANAEDELIENCRHCGTVGERMGDRCGHCGKTWEG